MVQSIDLFMTDCEQRGDRRSAYRESRDLARHGLFELLLYTNGSGLHIGVLHELANLLPTQWEKTLSLEMTTGQTIPTVFHWNDRGAIKPIHPKALYHRWKEAGRRAGLPTRIPHDFRRTAVRNLERAGVPRSVAMKLTGHKTEAVYRRYAIVCEADLTEGLKKLAVWEESMREKMQPCGTVTDFSHSLATVPASIHQITPENMAEGARFELADPLRGLQFSRLARSATPSPLRLFFLNNLGSSRDL
jgi:hypothetical protein